MFIEELGRELEGRMLAIWLGKSGESSEFEEAYRKHWRIQAKKPQQKRLETCLNLSPEHLRLINCKSCNNSSIKIKVYRCSVYGECTIGKKIPELTCCQGCPSKVTAEDQKMIPKAKPPMQWAYG
ncbi:hypothetical protein, partial [Stenotrophomonas maltophilia]|uniref:hypothetical protein n=1 Tax=Stenotrophomonas maltophilia TaxID=40324 RepID=UPI001E41B791